MSSLVSDLSTLLEIEREAMVALAGLAGVVTAPEAQECLDEVHYAMKWFCAGLEKHVRRPARRIPPSIGLPSLTTDQLAAAPRGVDRVRLLTRMQRSVLTRIEGVLAGSLSPDLRTFLEQARAVFSQSVHCCEEAIASLDRQREVHPSAHL